MCTRIVIFLTIFIVVNIWIDKKICASKIISLKYKGEHFPSKYLYPDDAALTISDLNQYLIKLRKVLNYFNQFPNSTIIDEALGCFFTKSILKRTIKDYGTKIPQKQLKVINDLVKASDNILSHYMYIMTQEYYDWNDLEFRVSRMFKDDSSQVYSIGKFNRRRLKKWILSEIKVNDFVEDMDKAVFPKEYFIREMEEDSKNYSIKLEDSDECLSRVVHNPEPTKFSELRPCSPDPFCTVRVRSSPSIAYTLSHRLLNVLVYQHNRRCYLTSIKEDELIMEQLCAFMYREAVYLARRGFFARDIFMEHIGLCALLGYEEFHRRQWFYKVTSWIDGEGCMQEFRNFNINRTALVAEKYKDKLKKVKGFHKVRKEMLENDCQRHPMLLAAIVLANAVRHSVYYLVRYQLFDL